MTKMLAINNVQLNLMVLGGIELAIALIWMTSTLMVLILPLLMVWNGRPGKVFIILWRRQKWSSEKLFKVEAFISASCEIQYTYFS